MAKAWAKAFYDSRAWKLTRKQKLVSCGYVCEMCGGHATEVHHEIELTADNINDPTVTLNVRLLHALCGDCHKAITKEQKGMLATDCDDDFYFNADGFLTPRGV